MFRVGPPTGNQGIVTENVSGFVKKSEKNEFSGHVVVFSCHLTTQNQEKWLMVREISF